MKILNIIRFISGKFPLTWINKREFTKEKKNNKKKVESNGEK